MAVALHLVKRGRAASRIALIDAKTVEHATKDPRSIALSYGSRQLLEEVAAWPLATDEIHHIHVSRRGHFGRTLIDRADYALPALGYVSRYGMLVNALASAVARTGVTAHRPVQLTSTIEREAYVELHLADGRNLTTEILVQAEGGLFNEQQAKTVRRDYEQSAIVAHVATSAPIRHRAFERFTNEGPLALLPQDDGYALVWCLRPVNAERMINLSDKDFLNALQNAFGTRLGRFISASSRNSYPLGLNAQSAASARTVSIGNAAQTLHPVAGQGLNLGLRDAVVLSRALAQGLAPGVLQRFLDSRNSDRNVTIRLTDAMARIFSSAPNGAFSQTLLGLSLGLIDAFKPGKRMLAEQMIFGYR